MRKAYLQMHIAIVLWGFTAILGKVISLDEGLLVWYRMMLSSIATFIFLLSTKKFESLTFKEIKHISGIGAVITLHWITFYGAIKASNVSIAISCFSSVALFTALLDPLIHKKLPRKSEVLLGIGVMLGIYIIFSVQQFYLKGIILSLVSAFLASLFTIMNKSLSGKHDPALITFYELGTGFLLLTCCLPVWYYVNNSGFAMPDFNDWMYLIILAVFCTTVAFTLSLHALKKLDAFTMNLSVNLEPLYSIVLAIILFHEDKMLNTGFYIGSFIILMAVVLHGYSKIRNAKKVPVSA
jgi:drug/metabolite transporter (DMT)-like permease